jgi:hypothetical protein
MASFTAGTTFVDGVSNDVTASKLGNLVTNATPTSGFIQDRTAETVTATNDTLLIGDASDSNNLKRITVANFAQTLPTANVTTGTIDTFVATGTITGSTNVINIGSGQIYKDASGKVGIGTTSPARLLTIESATNPEIGLYNSGTERVKFSTGGSAGSQLAIDIGGAEAMRIDSSRNVGIGGAPTTKLNVVGTSADYISAQIAVGEASVATGKQLQLGYNTTASKGYIQSVHWGTGYTDLAINPSGGNVGIGTASPAVKLDVSGGNIQGKEIFLENGAASSPALGTTPSWYSPASGVAALSTNAAERLRIDSSGGVTIAGLAGAGSRAVNASAAGLLSAASDASLKEEVVGAHIAGLSEILQIHPKMYRWKDDIANRGENASVELGFIANDVAPIIPSAAPLGNDGLYGFYDRSITAALVKAVQELKAENDSLKSRIEALEAK